jgi:hypothetical protein
MSEKKKTCRISRLAAIVVRFTTPQTNLPVVRKIREFQSRPNYINFYILEHYDILITFDAILGRFRNTKLDWAAVDKSIDSMNKRVQQVLKKHRGHIKNSK